MPLKEKLTDDLKEAMKSGDVVAKDTIRLLKNAIRNAEINWGHQLTDDEIITVFVRESRQRHDSIEQYTTANRLDLAAREAQELAIIETYLPHQLSDEEITAKAAAVIAELNVANLKEMGIVMQRLSAELKGMADGRRISAIVRSLLT